ncbi:hypothetical protein SAMN05660649_02063 [Desulfotomaculum arcticum]|uniref:Uncharacterized protein n=1 Tax=Desulfotruncus arcticus DSM 17038 TaxID=1121424 RepID=A0A1I2T078_9FIRM|nr:hypothetical protein [Desulfotruncus arcticus]SFG57539.1 hypothetical protein SAMN05660649_02063 [Desulfotomaculum arcticum] [Desulfotruncus arcticus DSM 17038]
MLLVFLPVLEMTLDAAADLVWLWEKIAGGRFRGGKRLPMGIFSMAVVDAGRESVSQLRRQRQFRLLDVDVGDVEVSVDLV